MEKNNVSPGDVAQQNSQCLYTSARAKETRVGRSETRPNGAMGEDIRIIEVKRGKRIGDVSGDGNPWQKSMTKVDGFVKKWQG